MYRLDFLPIAKQDIDDIIYYISNNLKNKTAAITLSNCFIEGAKSILVFPYGQPKYMASTKLKNEYRSIIVKNFLMFYTINEKEKVITIVRVLYKKMDIKSILD